MNQFSPAEDRLAKQPAAADGATAGQPASPPPLWGRVGVGAAADQPRASGEGDRHKASHANALFGLVAHAPLAAISVASAAGEPAPLSPALSHKGRGGAGFAAGAVSAILTQPARSAVCAPLAIAKRGSIAEGGIRP